MPVAEESWNRTHLPHTIAPGERFRSTLRVNTPSSNGMLQLRVTLVQESVMWFDDVDLANADIHMVQIAPARNATRGDVSPGAEHRAPTATSRVSEASTPIAAMLAEKDCYIEGLETTLERERRAGEEHRASLGTALAAKDDYIASLLAAVAASLAEKDAFIATLISGRERERQEYEDYRAAMDTTLAEKDTFITDLTAMLQVSTEQAIAQQAAVAAILAEKDDYIISLETTLERERRAGEEHRASLDTALAAKDDYIASLLAAQSSP
jgi:chromosome segregation ATPase